MTRNNYTLYVFISVFAIQRCATTFRLSVAIIIFFSWFVTRCSRLKKSITHNSRAQQGAHNACTHLGAYEPNTCLTITNKGRGGPESKEAWGERISSHERSHDAMTFEKGASDDDVATDEHAIENHTSSRSSTCLVLAFVALAVVTLGALTCFQTNFPTRANLDRASTMRRNASATIATPSRALTRPSSHQIELSRRSCLMATAIVV